MVHSGYILVYSGYIVLYSGYIDANRGYIYIYTHIVDDTGIFMDISSGKRLHSYGKIYHVKWENSQFRLGHFQWPTVELPEDTSGK